MRLFCACLVATWLVEPVISASGKSKPSFLTGNSKEYVPVGSTAVFECRVQDLGNHSVKWSSISSIFKGDRKVMVDNERRLMLIRESPEDWNLCIRDVKETDQGKYNCEINTTPSISRTATLIVIPPKCEDDQFTCKNSQCINKSQQCDDHQDCEDGLDEMCCDNCDDVPCYNGGTNTPSMNISRCCECPEGFTGTSCQECDPEIINCRNGTLVESPIFGTCKCDCNKGFRGKFCQLSGDYIELPKGDQCSVSKLDVVFAFDTSRGLEDFMFEFLKSFMDIKGSGPGSMHVGLVTTKNNVHRPLQAFHSFGDFISSVRRFSVPNINGLRQMLSHVRSMFSTRQNRRKFPDLVVLTINDNWNLSSAAAEARLLIEDNVHVMVIMPKSTPEVLNITSHPDAVIITGPFSEASPFEAARNVVLAICTTCDRGWQHIGDSCYRFFDTGDVVDDGSGGIKWMTAEIKCGLFGSELISINTEEESTNVLTEVLPEFTGLVYIGLQRDKGTVNPVYKSMFRWLDGTPPVYTKWAFEETCRNSSGDGETRMYSVNKCAAWELRSNCSGWVDVGCAHSVGDGFICEAKSRNYTPLAKKPPMVLTNADSPTNDSLEGTGLFLCQSGEFISVSAKCDRRFDCISHDDEVDCAGYRENYDLYDWSLFEIMCARGCGSPNVLTCGDGSCIPVGLYCNFIKDCPGGEDEDCVHPQCSETEWQCQNGQCIQGGYRCDYRYHCIDQSDEKNCETGVKNSFRCFDGSYIPQQWKCDGVVDCPGPHFEDETSCETPYGIRQLWCKGTHNSTFNMFDGCNGKNDCSNGFDETEEGCSIALSAICFWNRRMTYFRWMYLDIRSHGHTYTNCSNATCGTAMGFKCPGSFCIPTFMTCNGVMDCPDGEDEDHCDTNACPGLYRCANDRMCIVRSWFQDTIPDCPFLDDESYYKEVCAAARCSCNDSSITCSDIDSLSNTIFHKQTRKISVSNINIEDKEIVVEGLHYLAELILTNCSLKVIPSLVDLWNLLLLDLSHNKISVLEKDIFDDLGKLRSLYLNDNSGIQYLQPGCCDSLVSLEVLNIDRTAVTELNKQTFKGLSKIKTLSAAHAKISMIESGAFNLESLKHLILTGNPHINFESGVYDGATRLNRLETDNFYLCCEEVRPESLEEDNCKAPNYGLSSCTDLLQSNALTFFIWILSFAALLGNSGSFCYRVVYDKASLSRGYGVFVSNLSFSDFIMGIYLMIIAVAHRSYRDEYMWKDFDWRHSWVCQMAGFLSTLSCETSMMFICLITLDRFIVIKYPFGNVKFNRTSAIAVSLVVWVVCLILAGIPLLPSFAHWMLYSKSSVCLALPLVDLDSDGQTFSFTVFIGLNFVVFALVAAGQTSIYMSMRSGTPMKKKTRRSQDMSVAKKLSLVVITDFICWFPICIMGLMAATGTHIPQDTYAWTAVFVLPINSALNPFLYTFLSAIQKKMRKLTGATKIISSTHKDETNLGNTFEPKVTTGYPDSSLVSVRSYMNTDVESMSDLVKCLGHVIACLPKLHLVQKNHESLTPDNIFIGVKRQAIGQVCFGVCGDRCREIEEDLEAVTDIARIWSKEYAQSLNEESATDDVDDVDDLQS